MSYPILSPSLTTGYASDNIYRILALDGGGAKGFYTLGVLKEIEAMLGCPLHKRFDLVYGTSTGAIIAALIALGYEIDQILSLYTEHVPRIMSRRSAAARTSALQDLAKEVFQGKTFEDVLMDVGIVSTRWMTEKPMIFKGRVELAHGRMGTFSPGFGVSISDAVQASCSAYPFFKRKVIVTSKGDKVELIDGGYCANNPTLFAISDATIALKKDHKDIRVVNVGVGIYPEPKPGLMMRIAKKWLAVQLLQKTLEINTQSMDQLREILFKNIPTIRISDTFERPEMATDLLECNLDKLNILRQRGSESFATRETQLKEFLISNR